MTGVVDTTGARSGVIGTTVGTVTGSVAGTNNFIMAFSSDVGWSSGTGVIPFNSIEVDPDGCCNTTGSKFTAPSTGVYLFGFHVYTGETDYTNYFGFYVNGTLTNYAAAADAWGHTHDQSNDVIRGQENVTMALPLSASDYVTVAAAAQSDWYTGHSAWWGCRLR